MAELVDPTEIEAIVGTRRHTTKHYARVVTAEKTIYILHSAMCKAALLDLRDCPYSLALDRGVFLDGWPFDEPIHVTLVAGELVPASRD